MFLMRDRLVFWFIDTLLRFFSTDRELLLHTLLTLRGFLSSYRSVLSAQFATAQLEFALFLRGAMVITHYARYSPSAVFILPKVNEFPLTYAFRIFMTRMM